MSPDVLEISLSLNKHSVQAAYYWFVSEVWLCVRSNYWLSKHFRSWNRFFVYALPILSDPDQDHSPNSAWTPEGDHGKSFPFLMQLDWAAQG